MKINIEEANLMVSGLNNIFSPLKSFFDLAKKMAQASEGNQIEGVLKSHFKKMEDTFNSSVRSAFKNLNDDLQQSVENVEAFNNAMKGVADPTTAPLENQEQKRHMKGFSAV